MAKRTPAEVYASLTDVGFDPAQAAIMTAIAGAESGYDTTALGDTRLESSTWGPSYGLFQVRTSKRETGTGGTRDIARLASSDTEQAEAAYEISRHGTDFSPWSAYSSGAYQGFLPAASQVAAKTDGGGPLPTAGPSWLPWNWPSQAGNALYAETAGGVRTIALEGVFVVLGLVLVAAGVAGVLRPQIKAAGEGILRLRKKAATAVLAVAK